MEPGAADQQLGRFLLAHLDDGGLVEISGALPAGLLDDVPAPWQSPPKRCTGDPFPPSASAFEFGASWRVCVKRKSIVNHLVQWCFIHGIV